MEDLNSFSLKLPQSASLLVTVGQPQGAQGSAALLGSPLDSLTAVFRMVPAPLAAMRSPPPRNPSPWAALRDRKSAPLCLGVIKLWVEVLPQGPTGKFNNDELSGGYLQH